MKTMYSIEVLKKKVWKKTWYPNFNTMEHAERFMNMEKAMHRLTLRIVEVEVWDNEFSS